MNRLLSLLFLSIGTVLIIYGLNALDSVSSSLSRLFNGVPTDETIWLLLAGLVCFCIGIGGLIRGPKPTWHRS